MRAGFTLVEMLVAMALSLGIMLILTEAMRSSLDFVRSANAIGLNIQHLNGVGNALSRDLAADHFLPEDTKPNRGVALSNQRLDWFNVPSTQGWTPLKGGFFRIVAPQPPGPIPTDPDGFPATTVTNHQLQFTSILAGGTDQNLFSAAGPGGTPVYPQVRAAEVAYFLVPTGTKTSTGGQPLFNLIRRYRLCAMTSDDAPQLQPYVSDNEMISVSTAPPNTVNTLATLTNPANRLQIPSPGGPLSTMSAARFGEDILASNALSFEVMVQWDPNVGSNPVAPTLPAPPLFTAGNPDAPYGYLNSFDTAANPPPYIRVRSLQITVRIFDPRTKQARQNTWKFAM